MTTVNILQLKPIMEKAGKTVLVFAFCVGLMACSTTGQQADEVSDPLEDINRTTFAINEGLDKVLLEPAAKGYREVTPKGIRVAVRNFLRNLRSPLDIANQLLQGDIKGTGNATARAFINTFAGFGGILDVAEEGGIPYEREDFGQTLAKWGIGDGAYVFLPLIGPSSTRDSFGLLVDTFADPLRLYLHNTDQENWTYIRYSAAALSIREELIDVISDLRQNSFDYYAAVRSAYYQRRQALINDEDPDLVAGPDIPDYDDL